MTATDELRRMLDERGVRWKRVRGHKDNGTSWHDVYGSYVEAVQEYAWDGGEFPEDKMAVRMGPAYMTPEQAIAATLGSEDTYTRENVESAFVSGYSLGCLPAGSDPTWDQNEQTIDEHMAEGGWVREESATLGGSYQGFWTDDGTLHIELPKLPESFLVRLLDKRDREIRSAKVWRYTQEPETCHDLGGIGANGEDVFDCDKCGCVMSLYDSDGTNTLCTSFIYDYPRYCPACGRKVVE